MRSALTPDAPGNVGVIIGFPMVTSCAARLGKRRVQHLAHSPT